MPPTARDTVYDAMLSRLTSRYYAPDVVLVPGALSEEFGVSRTPAREALAFLERDGLLEAAQRGYVIRQRSEEDILELFEARAMLDAFAAEAAAIRSSPIDIAGLTELTDGIDANGDEEQVREALGVWHAQVRAAAHNSTVSGILRQLDGQLKVSMLRFGDTRQRELDLCIAEHAGIFAAIRDRDGAAARRLMLAHLEHDRDLRIRFFAEHRFEGFVAR